jgi:hypothetical protein
MPKAPTRPPKNVALKIAELFRVPKVERVLFCDFLCDRVQRLWGRDRRAVSSKPSSSLREAAKATRTLQKAFDRLPDADRKWVENIRVQSALWGEGLDELETTVKNLAIVFNHSVGRSSPIPRRSLALNEKLRVTPLNVKDQMFKEVVIVLMSAAVENQGKFTLDANCKTGTLVEALDLLRDHLPQDLVPNELPAGTIQKIKKQFYELRS